MLPRPVFKLKVTPDATDTSQANYQLTVEYVPDPEQTYSLRLSPTALTETSFAFQYSESLPGVLSSIGGGVKEQVTPTITAIGDFAASVIPFDTTSASAVSASVPANIQPAPIVVASTRAMVPSSSAEAPPAPAEAPGKPVLLELVEKIQEHCDTVQQVADDIRYFVPGSLDPSAANPALWRAAELSMRTLYHYKTAGQRDCLETIARTYIEREKKDIEREKRELLRTLIDDDKGTLQCPSRPVSTDRNNPDWVVDSCSCSRGAIQEALQANDIKGLTAMLQQVKRAIDAADRETEQEEICLARWTSLRKAIEIVRRPSDGRIQIVKFLEFIALMPEDIWRARRILFLRNMRGLCIAESIQGGWSRCEEQFRSDNVTDLINGVDCKIAVTAGEQSRYERMLQLSRFLSTVPNRDVQGGKAPAAAEYAAIRGEFDALSTSYNAAVDAVVVRNRDAPELTATPSVQGEQDVTVSSGVQKVSARDLFDVPVKPLSFVAASRKPSWDSDDKPEFVIVVEPYAADINPTTEPNQ